MDMQEIANRTTVYWNCKIKTFPSSWPVGNAELVEVPFEFSETLREPFDVSEDLEGNNIVCIKMLPTDQRMCAEDLPTEFFNHQLLKVDTDDRDSVVEFVSHWGIPFSPYRNKEDAVGEWGIYEDESLTGINETEEAIRLLSRFTPERLRQVEISIFSNEIGDLSQEKLIECFTTKEKVNDGLYADTAGYVVSLREAAMTLRILQNLVFLLDRCISTNTWVKENVSLIVGTLSAGSSARQLLAFAEYQDEEISAYSTSLRARGMLTAAICNQLCDTIADREPWRVCANEKCSVIFKRQQALSRRRAGKYTKPYAGSIYCSTQCSDAQRKRNKNK